MQPISGGEGQCLLMKVNIWIIRISPCDRVRPSGQDSDPSATHGSQLIAISCLSFQRAEAAQQRECEKTCRSLASGRFPLEFTPLGHLTGNLSDFL